ncbi:hypothetical protein L6452_41951 [Arctium lappa]|uniref:Uncharacterized protein n=1 Tax=Arctium lappa TaxID=4217 RepID=A0ACB8XHB8_ARCLA|nr:hypothetical protein L6452_41951 [Arctium lappa]
MLSNSSPEFSQKSLKIKQDDKFFSRLLSKETNPSFRVYYGNVSSAVPFTWEIQPGTPKHKFSDISVPPLTPPPSYYTSNHKPTKTKYYPRSNLLYNLLMNINLIKKGHVASSSPSSSSSSWTTSSSSFSSSAVSSKGYRSRRRRHFTSFGSSFDDHGHVYGGGSPDSVMCFGINNNKKSSSNGGGSYTVVIIKKAFLSIVGRRSAG